MCAFSPATIPSAGTTFNGGTITQPLAIASTDDGTIALDVAAPDSMGTSVFKCRLTGSQTLVDVSSIGGFTATKYSIDLTVARANLTIGTGTVGLTSMDAAGNPSQYFTVGQGRTFFYDGDANTEIAVIPAGLIISGTHAAPADGALVAGEVCLWFDQTDGAAKLMLKAKQANGTVKTGFVNVTT